MRQRGWSASSGRPRRARRRCSLDVAAAAVGAEIVSVDSRQVYRGHRHRHRQADGRGAARAPHHCLDLVDPDSRFDAARYRDAATAAIADIAARGRPVLVVGGTGLYLRVLLRGLCPGAAGRAGAARGAACAAARGGARRAAPRPGACSIRRRRRASIPRDRSRLVRALEVVLASGRPLSAGRRAHGFAEAPYEALVIGLAAPPPERSTCGSPRAAQRMVAPGFVERGARPAGARLLPATPPRWRAVGYREMRAHVEGACDLDDGASRPWWQATRRFAKRQRTWFRAEPARGVASTRRRRASDCWRKRRRSSAWQTPCEPARAARPRTRVAKDPVPTVEPATVCPCRARARFLRSVAQIDRIDEQLVRPPQPAGARWRSRSRRRSGATRRAIYAPERE